MSKRDELYACKKQAMKLMAAGQSWQEANEQSGLNYCQSGVHRLYREWKKRGDEALKDNRHGHPYKVTREIREWLVERCQDDGEVRSPQIVEEIKSSFGVELHHDYVNLLRNQLGLPAARPGRPFKSALRQAQEGSQDRPGKKEKGQPATEKRPEEDFFPRGDRRANTGGRK